MEQNQSVITKQLKKNHTANKHQWSSNYENECIKKALEIIRIQRQRHKKVSQKI